KLIDESFHTCAKHRSTDLRKDLNNILSRAQFDDVIRVEEKEMQLPGNQLAHGGFARPHETDERNVMNLARGAHTIGLTDLGRIRTEFFGDEETSNIEHRTPNLEVKRRQGS